MQTMSRFQRAAAIATVGALAGFGAWTIWTQLSPRPGDQARPIATQLTQLAGDLQAADARGDRAAAANLADPLTATLRRLNDTPGIERSPLHNCRLAAVQLVQGVDAVHNGGRWQSRDRFENALNACR